MAYEVLVGRRVQKFVGALEPTLARRIRAAIDGLAGEPRPAGCRKLTDRDAWRIRVGDYRILYQIDDRQVRVFVIEVGHRREVYD